MDEFSLTEEKEAMQSMAPDLVNNGNAGDDVISDEEYPQLLVGDLTKKEFLFLLAYGPPKMKDGLSEDEFSSLLNELHKANIEDYGLELKNYLDNDSSGYSLYNIEDLNRLFSVFTDKNLEDMSLGYKIVGDKVFVPDEAEYEDYVDDVTDFGALYKSTEILDVKKQEDKIEIQYTVSSYALEDTEDVKNGTEIESSRTYRVATLEKNSSEKYRITKIATKKKKKR